jgi:MFS family permease
MDSSHTSRRPALAVKVGASATVLAFLDTTVTNLAVPPVAAEFSVGITAVAWLATAYVIPFAAFLAPAWFTTLAALLVLTGAGLLRPVVPQVPDTQPTKEAHR